MRPHFKMTFDKKINTAEDAEPTDVAEAFLQVLPKVANQTEKDFIIATEDQSEKFTPPGTLLDSFDTPEGPYEIWKGSLAEPRVRQLVMRAELMVLFFIEGGSTIVNEDYSDASDARWTVYFLYQKKWLTPEKDSHRYTFAGYCTVYRFYMLEPPTAPTSFNADKEFEFTQINFDLSTHPSRLRISQFLILPPFLHKGNGTRLYRTVFQDLHRDEHCKEITVEDPNEAFDDLRDYNDLRFIRTLPEVDSIKINTKFKPNGVQDAFNIVDPRAVAVLKKRTKIAPRQLGRLIDMHLMSCLPDSVRPRIEMEASLSLPSANDKRMYGLWKQMVKARIYRHNIDALQQMEKSERIEKLEETQKSVEFEYLRLLALSESRDMAASGIGREENGAHLEAGEALKRDAKVEGAKKRLLEEAEAAVEIRPKKARVEDDEKE